MKLLHEFAHYIIGDIDALLRQSQPASGEEHQTFVYIFLYQFSPVLIYTKERFAKTLFESPGVHSLPGPQRREDKMPIASSFESKT